MNDSRSLSKIGLLYCVLAGVFYVGFNYCIGEVSKPERMGFRPEALQLSHFRCELAWDCWINCTQALVTVAPLGAYLLWQAARGRRVLPPLNELIVLCVLGLAMQSGAVIWTWAMSIIGVAITATVQTGIQLVAAAILGLVVLSERLSWTHYVAIIVVTVSVPLLSLGKTQAENEKAAIATASASKDIPAVDAEIKSAPGAVKLGTIILAVGAAGLAGASFAALSVGVRKTMSANTSAEFIVFLMSFIGVVALGPFSAYLVGVTTLRNTEPSALGIMLGAGVFNLIAYFSRILGLKTIPVLYSTLLVDCVTAILSAAVGILLLAEGCNVLILGGIAMAIGGIVVLSLPTKPAPEAAVAVAAATSTA